MDVFGDDDLPDALVEPCPTPAATQDWLWRELSPSSAGTGSLQLRRERRRGCSVLCEPAGRRSGEGSVFVVLDVDPDQHVHVSLSPEKVPWSLSSWEVDGLRAMGESRAAKVREKRERALKRLRIERACSADRNSQYCTQDQQAAASKKRGPSTSSELGENSLFDSAMEEVHLKHDAYWSKNSPWMEDMSRVEEANQAAGSNKALRARRMFSCMSFSACWVSIRGCAVGCAHPQ